MQAAHKITKTNQLFLTTGYLINQPRNTPQISMTTNQEERL